MKSDEEYLESLLQAAISTDEKSVENEESQSDEDIAALFTDSDTTEIEAGQVGDTSERESVVEAANLESEKSEEDTSWDDLLAELEGIEETQSNNTTAKNFSEDQKEESSDNMDITELLDKMDGEDEDLSEINELLKKSDSGQLIDEAQKEAAVIPEKSELPKKEKKGLFGRKKKKKAETENKEELNSTEEMSGLESEGVELEMDSMSEDGFNEDLTELLSEPNNEEPKKKKGFIGRLLELLTEEVEEDEVKEKKSKRNKKQEEKEENKEVDKEDKNENEDSEEKVDENAAILEEMNEEDKAAKKGKKKTKKEKPKKEKVAKAEEPDDGKALPLKMVIRIFILCGSILIMLVLVNMFLSQYRNVSEAREAYYKGDYKTAYNDLLGRTTLNKSDTLLLKKATLLMKVERQYESYVNYEKMGMSLEALDALITGCSVYDSLKAEAQEENILPEFEEAKRNICDGLKYSFNLTEEMAFEISKITDSLSYTKKLKEIVSGNEALLETEVGNDENSDDDTQKQLKEAENLLPEEQEILNEQDND